MPDFYRSDNNQSEGIALAHTIHGSPLNEAGFVVEGGQSEGVGPATWSTAPYVPPARRQGDSPEKVLCSTEDCKAFPTKKYAPLCLGCARREGMAPPPKRPEPKPKEMPAWAQLGDLDGDDL